MITVALPEDPEWFQVLAEVDGWMLCRACCDPKIVIARKIESITILHLAEKQFSTEFLKPNDLGAIIKEVNK